MPGSKKDVETALRKVTKVEEVFGVLQVNGAVKTVLWSKAGGSAYAHDHAEYNLHEEFKTYDLEEGEVLEVELTLKWSPCLYCAMQLSTFLQLIKQKQSTAVVSLKVYYLDVYRGKNAIDPTELQGTYGFTCTAYESTETGRWWAGAKPLWKGQMG